MKRASHVIRFINKKILELESILSGMTIIVQIVTKKTLVKWIQISSKWNVCLDDSWMPKAYPRLRKLYPNLPYLYEENNKFDDSIDSSNHHIQKWLLQLIITKHN